LWLNKQRAINYILGDRGTPQRLKTA